MTLDEARKIAALTAKHDTLCAMRDALTNGESATIDAGYYAVELDPEAAKALIDDLRRQTAAALAEMGVVL